ncbi:MAG: PKD domain-containing protein, partial [Proteobacteria bacterium]|nr:PKD domain-containing protein [Pseudomonadota bacterium]
WNFGTGGPSARTVEDPGSVTFPTAGSYTVTYTVRDNDGDTSSDTVLVTVNAAYVDVNPTASITSPSANVSITAGGSVNFQASVSSGNAPLTHAWNFGTGGPSARTVEDPGSVTFTKAGSYTVTYTVTDNDGDTSSDSVVVTVNAAYVDVNPTASITSPSANVSITAGGSVNFQASVSSGNAPLTHAWNFGTGGPSARTVEDPGSVTFPTAGSYTVTYTVRDNDGDTSSDSVVVTVNAAYVDVKPTASITSPSTNVSIIPGGTVNFQASVSSGNAPLTHAWNFGTGGPSAQTVEDPGSVTFPTAGSYTITYTVTDKDGDTSSDTVLVTVKAAYVDLTPSASITSPSSKVGITAGESVDFQASVSSGNAPLSYSWSFGTGAPSGQSVEDPGSVIFSDAGIYDVVFTVTDSDGDVSSATVSITVTTADTQVSGDDTVVSLTPVLVSNVDDAEPFTQWQISTDNEFNTVVMNVVTENSSIINVPLMVLTGKTKYYWRTKKNLSKSIDSTWSEPQSFVTDAITWNDNDGNRVRDDQEAPMGIDLNNDGIADYNQPDTITCVKSLIGSSSIGLVKMDNVVDIEVLESIDPDTIMDKVGRPANMPEGLLGFRIVVENPGDTVKIGVCLSEAAPEGAGWYKYDSISGWQDYTDHATFSPDRKMITVELTDGGEGDADGYANGVIVDPSGIGMEFATPVMAMGTPGADQGCFISIGSSNESTPPWQGLFAMVLFLASLSLRSGQKKSSDK